MHTLVGTESTSSGFEGQFKVTMYVLSLLELWTISKVSGPRSFLSLVYSSLSAQQCTILVEEKVSYYSMMFFAAKPESSVKSSKFQDQKNPWVKE